VIGDESTVVPLLAGVVPNTDENLYVEFSGPVAFAGAIGGKREDALSWIHRERAPLAWNSLIAGERR
jgi:hypothetical protein